MRVKVYRDKVEPMERKALRPLPINSPKLNTKKSLEMVFNTDLKEFKATSTPQESMMEVEALSQEKLLTGTEKSSLTDQELPEILFQEMAPEKLFSHTQLPEKMLQENKPLPDPSNVSFKDSHSTDLLESFTKQLITCIPFMAKAINETIRLQNSVRDRKNRQKRRKNMKRKAIIGNKKKKNRVKSKLPTEPKEESKEEIKDLTDQGPGLTKPKPPKAKPALRPAKNPQSQIFVVNENDLSTAIEEAQDLMPQWRDNAKGNKSLSGKELLALCKGDDPINLLTV